MKPAATARFEAGSLLDVPFGEWAGVLELPEGEAYRARQIQEWVFVRRVNGRRAILGADCLTGISQSGPAGRP